MTTIHIDNGIFGYAAACEKQFESYLHAIQHGERKTTFISDLSLAEPFGSNGIKDTHKRVMKEWLSNYEYIAEYIMSLNFKSWVWHAHEEKATNDALREKCRNMSALYADLFYEAQDKAYKAHEDDDKAVSYLFHYLD